MTRTLNLMLPPPPGAVWTEALAFKILNSEMTISTSLMGHPGMPVGRYVCVETRIHWTGNLRTAWEAAPLG